MKILTDQAHPIIDWAWRNMGHEVETLSPSNLAADVYILKNFESFRVIGLTLQKAGITNPKVILFQQNTPYPLWNGKAILTAIAKSPSVKTAVFYHEFHRAAWEFEGNSHLVKPTLNFALYPEWVGANAEVITIASRADELGWAVGTDIWNVVTAGFQRRLIGTDNEKVGTVENGVVGYLPHKKVVEALVNCRMYVNPNIHLPLPYGFLEAMAVGTPMITNKNALSYTIYPNVQEMLGFMSPVVHEMRRALIGSFVEQDFVSNFKDMGVGARARAYVRDQFSNEEFAAQWNKVFEEVL